MAAWQKSYEECLRKGTARLELIRAGKPGRQAEGRFHEYCTTIEEHDDSPTKRTLHSRWSGGVVQPSHGYKNTPLPAQGTILSWQNKGAQGEPLTNADIYYCQYRLQHQRDGADGGLPGLRILMRQQASSESLTSSLDYVRWQRNTYEELVGTFPEDSPYFSLILGSENGTAACYLVLCYGKELGISGISSIERKESRDLIFTFRDRVG
ncbi:hypothetical protein ABNF97_02160 [Plantactinospora sp. B6F1]|uniref:hypothetical protein n=1 Tax=Plantactinospora sp. B6F1 TaxID=3158971 RepID=UPI00102CA278